MVNTQAMEGLTDMTDIDGKDHPDKTERRPTQSQLEAIEDYQRERTSKGNGHAENWKASLMTTKSAWASNAANCVTALKKDDVLRGAFAYDEMLGAVVLTRPLPGYPNDFKRRPITDQDLINVQTYLQQWLKKVGVNTVRDAIIQVAMERPFHPLRLWLRGLEWDGEQRARKLFSQYFGADETDYNCAISTMFLISMVARVMEPGCKCDYMVVLEGPQGYMKSLACKVLGGEYFDDQMMDITSKDASLKLRGKWLIEWSEMRAYTRAETNLTKAFLTRTIEHYRPPYGRLEVAEPRQCVFIGSTNQFQYLTDETGGRRFWPVKIGSIDINALERDRDQLFAEAAQLYAEGYNWWPDPVFEENHIKPEQAARYDADAWEEPINTYLTTRGDDPLTVIEVARGALAFQGDHISKFGNSEQKRIKQCLLNAGWVPKRLHEGKRVWVKAR